MSTIDGGHYQNTFTRVRAAKPDGYLSAEVETLQLNGRAAEEIRTFAFGRMAASAAIALVAADALATRIFGVLNTHDSLLAKTVKLTLGVFLEFGIFAAIFVVVFLGARGTSRLFRSKISRE